MASSPMNTERRRATIADVAKEAGVSAATAGRALGDYGYVREEIRERVRKAAEALGYRPNSLARSMITGRTNTIGVVGADIANPFFASAMRGIGDVARRDGFGTILTNSDEDVALEREAVGLLLQKQVDGIIVSPASPVDADHLIDAVQGGTPVVLLDRDVAGLAADAVLTDSVGASRTAVGHLLALGHRRIAIIAELRTALDKEWPNWIGAAAAPDVRMLMPSGARLLGYIQAHEAAGVPVDPRLIRGTGSYDPATAREQTLATLRLDPPPSAIFTVDNVMTHGAYQACRSLGIRIPEDLSFVAYDDMEWMTFVEPNITALSQPVYEMGKAAAELLIRRLRSPGIEPSRCLLDTTLIVRGSTMAPR
ncbi:LacI family DNA-binding transcriptional regulator [Azospirillum sp. YIM B02556]|uniref:LacI family DNA-binding transcriptional regulator n=1 Tax=Azospirillum endophyticum TaxID=2800326 RepID=A0ABS1FHM9_9PROT|nr:LacI family DNA-binding transcriptional regulator [Azospirillum endophyticum]MBK1842945.1 LacI family DNA-binding transcriptional regulator [Azospirillum endophyticum]